MLRAPALAFVLAVNGVLGGSLCAQAPLTPAERKAVTELLGQELR